MKHKKEKKYIRRNKSDFTEVKITVVLRLSL